MMETKTSYRVTDAGLEAIKRFLLDYHRDFHPTSKCPACGAFGTIGDLEIWEGAEPGHAWEINDQWECAGCGHAWGIDDSGEPYGMDPIPDDVLHAWATRAECSGASRDDDDPYLSLSIEIGAAAAYKRRPVTLSLWRCLGEIEPD